MVRTLMAVVLVLFAPRGVAAAYPPDPAPDAEASSYVASLIDDSAAMALPIRIERAFLLSLNAAGEALRRGDASQAAKHLKTFAFEVRGVKRARRLRADTADMLIARAEAAIVVLGRPH